MSEVEEAAEVAEPEGEEPHQVEIAYGMLAGMYEPDDVVELNGLVMKRLSEGRLWAVYCDGEVCDAIDLWKFKSAIELGQYLSRVRHRVQQSDSDGEAPWLQ